LTEPQSNKPITAAEAFEAAGENLRQAEKGWSDTRVPDALVSQVVDIANAWTALGVGLSNAECPIPTKLVGDPLGPIRYVRGEEELSSHEHGPNCRHQWVRPMEPCRNGCESDPFATPIEADEAGYCPETCPDVNA
jgi:hypothetical protein